MGDPYEALIRLASSISYAGSIRPEPATDEETGEAADEMYDDE